MGSLTALLIATPIFGLSLPVPDVLVEPVADVALTAPAALNLSGVDASVLAQDAGAASGGEEVGELMARRGRLAPLHRALGIATWSSMAVTTVLGFIQYFNLYGVFAGRDENPCVEGNAVFGQGQCSGVPWLHMGSSLLTTALYGVTYGLSMRMPDPLDLAAGDSDYARNLRTHKVLRWVHLGGMITQVLLGIFVANSARMGINRSDDYGLLQALATVHVGVGLVTLGALSWAAVIQL